jgi:mannobiose 2-epimerase
MNEISRILDLRKAAHDELFNHILPYWSEKVYDAKNGAFHGRIDVHNKVHPSADRSAILYTRIAYTYAAAYSFSKDISLLTPLKAAIKVLDNDFIDPTNGGLYWMIHHNGSTSDAKKHVYVQSFGIYAYVTNFKATGDKASLQKAIDLFELIEHHAFIKDQEAYHEAFDQFWNPIYDVRLGNDDAKEPRSTNTHLHILEALTALFSEWPDEKLRSRLKMLIHVFLEKVYNKDERCFYSFFDEHWNPRSSVYSYGHDIETIWLLLSAAKVIEEPELLIQCEIVAKNVADMVLEQAINPKIGGIYTSGEKGVALDKDMYWWPQAEAVVGLLHVYLLTRDLVYLNAVESLWQTIQCVIIDHQHGEWHFAVNQDGKPYNLEDKVGPWKCPYHTSRACLMVLELTAELIKSVPESESLAK